VVYWLEFLATETGVSSLIPGADRFSEQQWVWNGVHSASSGQMRSDLEEIVAASVYKIEVTTMGIRCADHVAPSNRKSWH
jgi:hypothetical protein